MLFNKLKQYDPERGEFGAWLYTLCVHTILNILKQQKKQSHIVYMENLRDIPVSEEAWDELEEQKLIAAIQKLPDGYREVINLFVFENWSHRQISQHLGIAESASRSQLTRAKTALKMILFKTKKKRYEKRLAR